MFGIIALRTDNMNIAERERFDARRRRRPEIQLPRRLSGGCLWFSPPPDPDLVMRLDWDAASGRDPSRDQSTDASTSLVSMDQVDFSDPESQRLLAAAAPARFPGLAPGVGPPPPAGIRPRRLVSGGGVRDFETRRTVGSLRHGDSGHAAFERFAADKACAEPSSTACPAVLEQSRQPSCDIPRHIFESVVAMWTDILRAELLRSASGES